jgi:hypothetical protein
MALDIIPLTGEEISIAVIVLIYAMLIVFTQSKKGDEIMKKSYQARVRKYEAEKQKLKCRNLPAGELLKIVERIGL